MSMLSNYYVVEQLVGQRDKALLGVQPTLRTAQQEVPAPVNWREPQVTDGRGPLTWSGRDDEGRAYEISLVTTLNGQDAAVAIPQQREASFAS